MPGLGGRPYKQGLDYYNHYFVKSRKVQDLLAAHPDKGYEVYFRLLETLYYENGYFLEWCSRQKLQRAAEYFVSLEKLQAIIDTCLDVGLFDRTIYDKYQILTSATQQTYFLSSCAKRLYAYIIRDFSLISEEVVKTLGREQITYYADFENISDAFDSYGFLVDDWETKCTKTLVVQGATAKQGKKKPVKPSRGEQMEMPLDAQAPLIHLPGVLDWDAEKLRMFNDLEWKMKFCQTFRIGTYSGREFLPNMDRLEASFEPFWDLLELRKDKKSKEKMQEHFYNWYPKHAEKNAAKAGKEKSSLHIGSQNFSQQRKLK